MRRLSSLPRTPPQKKTKQTIIYFHYNKGSRQYIPFPSASYFCAKGTTRYFTRVCKRPHQAQYSGQDSALPVTVNPHKCCGNWKRVLLQISFKQDS